MKIRYKLAFFYSAVTALLMVTFACTVYLVSSENRETQFYENIEKEAISRANLYFEAKASPEIMHSIYKNNIEYVNEAQVAIFTAGRRLVYHDAKDRDIVQETPELFKKISSRPEVRFNFHQYQVSGFTFYFNSQKYFVTTAAHDTNGLKKLHKLGLNLIVLSIISIMISFVLGYVMAKRALQPVDKISGKIKEITAKSMHLRLERDRGKDEFSELAASFNNTLDRLENSFNSQKMFISNVSHEIRTPLSSLIAEIDIALLKEQDRNTYIQTLVDSKKDTEKIIVLLNGLTDLAKAEYDPQSISMGNLRIDELLLDARETVLRKNRNYKVELLFNQDIENDDEITVYGNEYLLKTAFSNLMENNCKFSADKTSSVSISFYKNTIKIQFGDTGIGIKEEEMDKIFDPFYRGSNKNYANGNGIGLALVKRVVSLHKGKIKLKSQTGEGTLFCIELESLSLHKK